MNQSHNDSGDSQIDENLSKIDPRKVFDPDNCFWLRILHGMSRDLNSYCNPINGFPNDILNYLKPYVSPLISDTGRSIIYHVNMELPSKMDPYLPLPRGYNLRLEDRAITIYNKYISLRICKRRISFAGECSIENKNFIRTELTKIFPGLEIISSRAGIRNCILDYGIEINIDDILEKIGTRNPEMPIDMTERNQFVLLTFRSLTPQNNKFGNGFRILKINEFKCDNSSLSIKTNHGFLIIHKSGSVMISANENLYNLDMCLRTINTILWG